MNPCQTPALVLCSPRTPETAETPCSSGWGNRGTELGGLVLLSILLPVLSRAQQGPHPGSLHGGSGSLPGHLAVPSSAALPSALPRTLGPAVTWRIAQPRARCTSLRLPQATAGETEAPSRSALPPLTMDKGVRGASKALRARSKSPPSSLG